MNVSTPLHLPPMEELSAHDERIPYFHLALEKDLPRDLTSATSKGEHGAPLYKPFPVILPEGYGFTFYKPGDKEDWIDIEISCREAKDAADGERMWNKYFAPHEEELPGRMIFLVKEAEGAEKTGAGQKVEKSAAALYSEKVGTATAYYDALSQDDGILGWLHFVGLKEEEHGKHLSKALIGYTLNRLMELGYKRCHISTQTITWLAVKIYLDFGFLPTEKSLREEAEGWKIIREITHHPALEGLGIEG